MTPEQFIRSASRAGVFDSPRLNDAIEWASDQFLDYVLSNQLDEAGVDEAASHFTQQAMQMFNLHGDRYTDDIMSSLFNLSDGLQHNMQNQESIKEDATRLVNTLLDEEESQAELELNTVSVDSMPHTTWMLRAVGADPTAYIAKDLAHTHELAMQQAQDKARLLGVQITKVIDNSKGGRA